MFLNKIERTIISVLSILLVMLTGCTGAGTANNPIDELLNIGKDTSTATPTATGPSFSLSYDDTDFAESNLNDGSISTTVTITLSSTTSGAISFTGNNGDDLVGLSKVTVSNVPTGLTAYMTKISDTVLTFGLSGNATSHSQGDSITNVSILFNDTAFSGAVASRVVNFNKDDFSVTYNALGVTYSTSQFTEAGANDGTIGNTIYLDLSGDTYTGSNGDDFIAGGKATISNVPGGLSASLTRTSSTRLTFTLSGTAASHLDSDDISNLTLTLNDSAFSTYAANQFLNYSRSNLVVNFINPVSITYSTVSLEESGDNDGSIDQTISLSLTNDTFTGANGSNLVTAGKVSVTNLPTGLTAVVTKSSSTTATISFTGTASSHNSANSITNLTFTFSASAFTNTTNVTLVSNYLKNDISITFYDTASMSFSASTFAEDSTNVGTTATTSTITLANDTFTGSNGENFVASGKVTVSNLPTGLSLSITRASSTTATIAIGGTALSHANANDVSNLTLTWDESAFTFNDVASNVVNYAKSDFIVNFLDLYQLSYSATTFSEAAANDGTVSTSATLTLTGTTWNAIVGTNLVSSGAVVVSNVPAGLSASAVVATASTITLTFTGTATTHTNAQDVTNVTLAFGNSAFSSGAAAGVQNATYTGVYVDFSDPASLSYSSSTFSETSANTGAIGNNISIVLSNNTFDGTVAEDFVSSGKIVVTNVPAGLTAVATYISTTALSLSLTGNAASHISTNNISNLTITFQATAFTNGVATNVSNYLKNDFVVSYSDPASLAYSATTFSENSTNDGSISNTSTITITNDTFSGSNSDNFVTAGKISVSNLPAGLTLVATRASATTITISITGNATAHESTNDVSNLTLTFTATAFTNNTTASNVTNYAKNDLIVDFANAPSIAFSTSTITEAEVNTGTITSSITLTLTGDSFTGTNGDNFISGSKASVSNLPAGLTAVVTRTSSTVLTLSFTGNATAHASAQSISNFGITLANSAFTNTTTATNVTNYSKTDFAITFLDPHSITLSTSSFSEDSADNGAIGNSITMTLTGTTFTGSNSDNFLTAAKVYVTNAPAGHTPVMTRLSSTTLRFELQGTASAHYSADTISNLTYAFDDSAFAAANATAITNYSKSDLNIAYFAGTVAPPNDVNVSNTTTTTAVITWNDNSNNEASFDAQVCEGSACTSSAFTPAAIVTALPTNTATYTFTGLTEGNYYQYRVRAKHDEDTSAWAYSDLSVVFGGIHTTDNGDGDLDEAGLIDCGNQQGAYGIVKWTEISGASSYMIYNSTSGTDVLLATVNSGTNYYIVKNLALNTSYSFKVKVIMGTTGVISTNSSTQSITTSSSYIPCGTFPNKSFAGGGTRVIDFYSPSHVWHYSGKVFITDTTNNRVLIYNGVPTTANATPYMVYGQVMATATAGNNIGTGATVNYANGAVAAVSSKSLNAPISVWAGDVGGTTKLAIADTTNNRVLLFNQFFLTPTPNAYPTANIVLGQPSMSVNTANNGGAARGMSGPQYVFSDGTKLIVSDTTNNRVLIWDNWPTSNYQAPDHYLGQTTTTAVGAGACAQGVFSAPRGIWLEGTRLLVADSAHNRVLIYDDITTLVAGASAPAASWVLGGNGGVGTEFTTCTAGNTPALMGAPYGIYYDSTNSDLYVADTTYNRIKIWDSGIPSANGATSHHVIGLTNNGANAAAQTAPRASAPRNAIAINDYSGTSDMVVMADTSNHRVNFFNAITTADNTSANFTLGKSAFGVSATANFQGITSTDLNTPWDIEVTAGGQMIVADYAHHRLLVWNSVPTVNGTTPDYVVGQGGSFTTATAANTQSGLNGPTGLCSGDGVLFVAEYGGNRVAMYSLPINQANQSKIGVLGQVSWVAAGADTTGASLGAFENPRDCFYDETNNRLYVSDLTNHRVLYWPDFLTNFATAIGSAIDGVGADYAKFAASYYWGVNNTAGTTTTNLSSPRGVWSDGTYVYVVDTTNNRVLQYTTPPSANSEAATMVLGQPDYVTSAAGTTQSKLSAPSYIYGSGTKLFVTDLTNKRIVMWDSPGADGEVITAMKGQVDYVTARSLESGTSIPLFSPSGLYVNSERIFATDTGAGYFRVFWFPIFSQ